jgi:hypothetical protein
VACSSCTHMESTTANAFGAMGLHACLLHRPAAMHGRQLHTDGVEGQLSYRSHSAKGREGIKQEGGHPSPSRLVFLQARLHLSSHPPPPHRGRICQEQPGIFSISGRRSGWLAADAPAIDRRKAAGDEKKIALLSVSEFKQCW